jgi:SLT domain-containing protein
MYPLVLKRAGGGLLHGPGSGTSDNIMGIDRATGQHIVDVSPGEFVVNEKVTSANRSHLEALNSGALKLAGGGAVGLLPPSVNTRTDQGMAQFVRSFKTDPMNAFGPAGAGGGGMAGSGVQRWLPVVLQALALTGQSPAMAQTLLRRMNQESGGNQFAINRTDSNAAAGHPSQGLMQTIPGTFAAYRMPGLMNLITNPLSNIVASIRYALAVYGSLPAAYNRAGGYADGTDNAAPGYALVGERGPELLHFKGGEKVTPNHKLAGGGLIQNFATGGFVAADFSAMTSRMPTNTPTRADVTDLTLRRMKAVAALHRAEEALYKLRHTKGHHAHQLRLDEERLATARGSLRAVTTKLQGAESARTAASKPYATQFHIAAGKANQSTAAFLRNIDTLNKRGFHSLADQLLTAGDGQAYALAAAAVKSSKRARALSRDVTYSSQLQARLDVRQDKITARDQARADAAAAKVEKAAAAKTRAATLGNYAKTAKGGVKSTAKFYANLTKIADRGFGPLAAQLLDQSDEQAEIVAEQAVKASNAVVKGLNTSVTSATAQEAQRAALADRFAGVKPVKPPDEVKDPFAGMRYSVGGGLIGSKAVGAVASTSNHSWTINQVSDPIGTAQAVARRQAMLGAV